MSHQHIRKQWIKARKAWRAEKERLEKLREEEKALKLEDRSEGESQEEIEEESSSSNDSILEKLGPEPSLMPQEEAPRFPHDYGYYSLKSNLQQLKICIGDVVSSAKSVSEVDMMVRFAIRVGLKGMFK
ncbi:hypothetical protein ADUPG1_001426 [Aduncisulcus paluster]|uniref:Uncharacterized protein n=1 Tax=Aduncisulcus paluster TaxID=2918883 RepID=A0ABQ5KCJ7_9EUKA|nr:hypothetical protein ADUPG1_001426 [Aduncisulcus paluster]